MGDFYSIYLHNNCSDIIHEYCYDLDYYDYDEGWNEDIIKQWWIDKKCDNCIRCSLFGRDCNYDLNNRAWCDMYKARELYNYE